MQHAPEVALDVAAQLLTRLVVRTHGLQVGRRQHLVQEHGTHAARHGLGHLKRTVWGRVGRWLAVANGHGHGHYVVRVTDQSSTGTGMSTP